MADTTSFGTESWQGDLANIAISEKFMTIIVFGKNLRTVVEMNLDANTSGWWQEWIPMKNVSSD